MVEVGAIAVWKFILCTFAFLAWGFYELSGGSEFAPPPEKARVAKQLATYDVPEGSTQTATDLVAAAPSVSDPASEPSDAVEVTRQANDQSFTTVVPGDSPTLVSSRRPQARSADLAAISAETTTGTGETFTPTATVVQSPTPNAAADADLRKVAGNRVNMRGGPSTDYAVLAKLGQGDEVQVLETPGNGWVRLQVVQTGEIGWMAERLLTR